MPEDPADRIDLDLARRLRDWGLEWEPRWGDRFVIPDRHLDDEVFWIAEMTVDVKDGPTGRMIAFNGTVEWALDSIMQHEVVWLPREDQLRDALGDRFRRLVRTGAGFRCDFVLDDVERTTRSGHAATAYGLAVLEVLVARDRPVWRPQW